MNCRLLLLEDYGALGINCVELDPQVCSQEAAGLLIRIMATPLQSGGREKLPSSLIRNAPRLL